MDEARARELRIEEAFPDGKVGTGFSYTFSPDLQRDYVMRLVIRLPGETLVLYFRTKEDYHDFVVAAEAGQDALVRLAFGFNQPAPPPPSEAGQ